jgi:hypothetical protein
VVVVVVVVVGCMVHLLRLHFSVIRAIRWFIPIA